MSYSTKREETYRSRRHLLKLGAGSAVGAVAAGIGIGHGWRGGFFARGLATAIDARDFGAIGDGVHDDASALQQGLNEAARLGQPLQIPGGAYSVGRALTVPSNVTLSGYGATLRTAFSDA